MMQLSTTSSLGADRAQFTIGRLAAHTPWRAANRAVSDLERENSIRLLMREAEEYGAHGLVELAVDVEECASGECQGVQLRRLVATGRAVRLALAA